ncbi:glyoxylase-like metal-dependent hydrolase (beta-lactamase superfamily II) [Sagittula marina]|uniref:Glyoxylase-like metal-dependent hydrolase (Beta-lactamase superfamily II) n=1 Tax=Sagittula marina TaxID=943940 RepID=A0A7W6DQR6_9RHOB|nr:MBL fold metallo-hydrolase [Sagittula marina]MBB3985212.1 glyoxylase-like metal-dependent hydrolase (beta-lactamase superfamily II) [Sagittula marina]
MQGVDRFDAGGVEVICLTDGATVFDPSVFETCPEEIQQARLALVGLKEIQSEFNVYVLRHAGGVDLVDTGCGAHFGDKAGRLGALLAEIGVSAEDVERVIFTHLHRDHVGGAMVEGRLAFPRARVVVHKDEAAFWTGKEGPADDLLKAVTPELVAHGADLGQGMTLEHLPGHTPGHSGLRIGDLMLVADIVHSEALQLPDPFLSPIYDVDGAQAADTRQLTLARIADKDLIWSGSHMRGPSKFARLRAVGDGFERVPL